VDSTRDWDGGDKKSLRNFDGKSLKNVHMEGRGNERMTKRWILASYRLICINGVEPLGSSTRE
jgi:hypothetical protein